MSEPHLGKKIIYATLFAQVYSDKALKLGDPRQSRKPAMYDLGILKAVTQNNPEDILRPFLRGLGPQGVRSIQNRVGGPHPILVHVDWTTVRLETNRKFPTGLKAGLKIVKMPTLTTVADGDGQAPTLETLRSW